MSREYVVICNRHDSNFGKSVLLFWGHYTKDYEKRSYGGYTTDLSMCERYTLDEVTKAHHKFDRYEPNCEWWKFDDFYISLEDLGDIGEQWTIVVRR